MSARSLARREGAIWADPDSMPCRPEDCAYAAREARADPTYRASRMLWSVGDAHVIECVCGVTVTVGDRFGLAS